MKCDSHLNCNAGDKTLFIVNGYTVKECRQCGHRFTKVDDLKNHLNQVYSDDYFFEGKAGYPDYLAEKDILIKAGKRYAKLISNYMTLGKLLDVGCAAGFIMKGFEDSGWECVGIEPNRTMASYGRNVLNLKINSGSLEEFNDGTKYDLICLIEVIGHFYDLEKATHNILKLLNVGGFVLVESWNMKSFVAKVLGKRWHEYSPPSVLNWFSDNTLIDLFKNIGMEIVAKGYPIKKINLEHAVSLLEEKLPEFGFKKKLFKMTAALAGRLTVIYPLHDLNWYLFKKTPSGNTA
jgi:2-polyprenyl-3-methyl-5-hydroxy-6-metoxy-1,4-benzoquinol methylase